MYTMRLDGARLYDLNTSNYILEKPTLTLEANKLATLKFTIYNNNPQYDSINKLTSRIKLYRDGELKLIFRPIKSKLVFRGGIEYTCEELAGYLNDVYTYALAESIDTLNATSFLSRTAYYWNRFYSQYPITIDESTTLVPTFNLVVGQTSATDNLINVDLGEYITFWESLQKYVVATYGGYVVPRYSEDANGAITITLDYLQDSDLDLNTQSIVFGKNLADLFIDTDTKDTFSVLIPLGKDEAVRDSHGNKFNKPRTIEAVNSDNRYLTNSEGLQLFGWKEHIERWSDIADKNELKALGQAYLDANAFKLKESISLTAYDLRYGGINFSADYLDWMKLVRVVSPLHNVEDYYPLTKLQIQLDAPSQSKITLGMDKQTFTDVMYSNKQSNEVANSKLVTRVFRLENPD